MTDFEVATIEKDVWVVKSVGEAMVVLLGSNEEARKGVVTQRNPMINPEVAEMGKDVQRSSVIDHHMREQHAMYGALMPTKRAPQEPPPKPLDRKDAPTAVVEMLTERVAT